MSMNKLLKEMVIQLKKGKREDDIPKGFFTIKQISKQMERSEWTARCYVNKAFEAKKMERAFFRVRSKSNSIILVPYYRLSK